MAEKLSDIGLTRKLNEDYLDFVEDDLKKIYIIADGMGGHNAGEVASKMAVESTLKYVNEKKDFSKADTILKDAIDYANAKIYEKSKENKIMSGMGTTITACLIYKDKMVVANVGDSGCFIVNDNGVKKVTKDHSLVQQLVDSGSITEEEAVNHPNKNIITRALGTNKKVDVDLFYLDVSDFKKAVLCTDGLTNSVNKLEMYDIVTKNDDKKACTQLVELSKLKGSTDNISVIIFEGE